MLLILLMVCVLDSGLSSLFASNGSSVRHLTLTVPLSTQVYEWGTGKFNAGSKQEMD